VDVCFPSTLTFAFLTFQYFVLERHFLNVQQVLNGNAPELFWNILVSHIGLKTIVIIIIIIASVETSNLVLLFSMGANHHHNRRSSG
jgi:hypothetical protein